MPDRPSPSPAPGAYEKALEAQLAQLEARASSANQHGPPGNLVDQLWRYLRAFVPAPIIAAAVLTFLVFHVLEFYFHSQMTTAETHLKRAQAEIEDVKAQGQITPIDGEFLRVRSLRAEVALKQAQAARARVEGDAQTALVDGALAALAKAKADVARVQAEADKARLAAQVATAQFGYRTLLDREQFVQFVKTELDKMTARHNIAAQNVNMNDSSLFAGYADRTYPTMIDARCRENALAKYLGCPARYFARQIRSSAAASASTPGLSAAPSFDCAKAEYDDERAICRSPVLARLDVLNSHAYNELLSFPRLRGRVVEKNKLILRSRRDCRDDVACIEAVQRRALTGFRALGAKISE